MVLSLQNMIIQSIVNFVIGNS